MPVFNGERYLKESINSILNQTYQFFEFIIINDGSTDKTEDIILSYSDNRIKYKKNKENIGVIKTLNIGIKISSGEFIARMDADDISHKDRLKEQLNFFRLRKDISVIGIQFNFINEEGEKIKVSSWPIGLKNIIYTCITGFCPLGHPGVMMKKYDFELTGNYNKNFEACEDYELWLRYISKGFKIDNIKKVLLDYRVHEGQVTSINRKKQSKNHILAYQNFFNAFSNKKLKSKETINYLNFFNENIDMKSENLKVNFFIYMNILKAMKRIHNLEKDIYDDLKNMFFNLVMKKKHNFLSYIKILFLSKTYNIINIRWFKTFLYAIKK